MATSCGYEFQKKHFGFADAVAEDFYVSQWFSNRLLFVVYKALIFIYWTSWVLYGTIYYVNLKDVGFRYPFYLTHWSEWTQVLYYGITLAIALYGYFTRESPTNSETCCIRNTCNIGNLRWFHHLCWVVRTSAVAVSYIITILFWACELESKAPPHINIHRHAMNSILITLDLFMDRVPVRFLHFVYASLFGLTYSLYTIFLHLGGVRSRFYDAFLDWERIPGISVSVAVGVTLIASPLLHVVTFGFYHLRALISRKCGCHSDTASSTQSEIDPALEENTV